EAGGGAEARWLEGIAAYEGGDRRRAERAADDGLRFAPRHGPLLVLKGLAAADAGRGEEALAALARALEVARDDGDLGLEGRATLNRGLVFLDRGEARRAEEAFTAASALGERA